MEAIKCNTRHLLNCKVLSLNIDFAIFSFGFRLLLPRKDKTPQGGITTQSCV